TAGDIARVGGLDRNVLYLFRDVACATSREHERAARCPDRPFVGDSGLGQGPACCLDLLLRRDRPRVGHDVELDGDLTAAQHLDQLAGAHGALGDEVVDRHGATLGEESGQTVQVDDLVLDAEGVLEAAELGQPHVQRHLPTLEAGRHLVAGLGALGAATRGLAALATLTASDADLGALGTGGGTQVVHLEGACLLGSLLGLCHVYLTSSTETRWATVVIMPRTS